MAQDETRPTGSPDPHMMLVPYQRGQRAKRIGIWIVSVLLTAVLCFTAGYYRGIRQNLHMVEQRKEMRAEIADLQQQLHKLQENAAIHRHGNELERQASERVRQENIALQDRVSDLEASVALYKGILAPEGNQKGLRIERIELSQVHNGNRFKYKLVLTQVADNSDMIKGTIKMSLLGTRQGARETVPFDRIARDWAGSDGAPFNFRFFQNIRGELDIPDGFVPEQIEVIAQARGRKTVRVERRFEWKLHEVTSDVGKG